MKKLITLLLVLTGMVNTASATKTIYVQNNCGWDQMRVHQWNSSTSAYTDYYTIYGSDAKVTTDQIDNVTYYKVTLDNDNYSHFVIHKNYSGNDDRKTFDLNMSDVTDGAYYYFKWNKTDGPEFYDLVSVAYYTYNFTAKTPTEWGGVKIYLWKSDKTSLTGDFPGTPMNKDTDVKYSYSRKSTESSLGLILTNYFSEGFHQSADYNALPGSYSYYLTDNGTNVIPLEEVTLNASGYCTYVNSNPLNIPASTAYYATEPEPANGSAIAHAITNPAKGTPMLIKGTPNSSLRFEVAASGTDDTSGNAFKAGAGSALASTTDGKYNYILNGSTFKAANGQTVRTNKAYLQLSQQAPAGARVLKFEDEDETTGINTVENGQPATENTAVYNLNGQRIMKPTKGLYIQNGKKYIVK